MSTTPHGTVEETGAKAKDILYGINRLNEDLKIQVLKDQAAVGKRVEGGFILIRSGVGAYAKWLKGYEGRVFEAGELLKLIKDAGAEKANHIFNRNQLKIYSEMIPDISTRKVLRNSSTKMREYPKSDAKSIPETISESVLEGLLIENPDWLESGIRLVKQQLDCREAGRLDLLFEDMNEDLVVVELKKDGVNHDFVVGQILRYIGYVKTHVAKPGQKVRGIIVVGRLNEKLKYAVSAIDGVEIKTFDRTII